MVRNLSDQLPARYFDSPEVAAAAGILWVLGEVMRARVLDWLLQLRVDTATWGLSIWEQRYGITPKATDTDADRRGRIKAKMRGAQTVTAAMLENLVNSYVDGESNITEIPAENKLMIQFNGAFGVPANIASLSAALLEVMPSHVAYAYLYRYLLVRDVRAMTVATLQQQPITNFAFRRDDG